MDGLARVDAEHVFEGGGEAERVAQAGERRGSSAGSEAGDAEGYFKAGGGRDSVHQSGDPFFAGQWLSRNSHYPRSEGSPLLISDVQLRRFVKY